MNSEPGDITRSRKYNLQGKTVISSIERFPDKGCLQVRIVNPESSEPTILETTEIENGNWIDSAFFFNYKEELVSQTQISCKKGSNTFTRGHSDPSYYEKIQPKIEGILQYISEHTPIEMSPP